MTEGPGLRLERLLPIAVVVSAGVLFASEFMTTFEFTPPGAEPLDSQTAADRHGFALAVLAVGAVVAMIVAISSGSKPAAMAVAGLGVIALLVFLLLDLPDANQIGTLDDPRESSFEAEAVPRPGFWLELVGALGLALSGAALATLTSDQLVTLRPGGGRKPKGGGSEASRRRRSSSAGGPAKGTTVIEQAEGFGEEVRHPASGERQGSRGSGDPG